MKQYLEGLHFETPKLADLYSESYDERMKEWRRLGAIEKASHIVALLAANDLRVSTILEVGSGTGAVLAELAEKNVGDKLVGLEINEERLRSEIRSTHKKIELHSFDGKTLPFPDASFDLVFATHVLEHVLDERGFIAEMSRVSRKLVFVEVPCELHMRAKHAALQETALIGHINSYTPESFALTLETSGLRIRDLRVADVSREVHQFQTSWLKASIKYFLRGALLEISPALATKLFTYHCFALCEKAAPLSLIA